MNSRPDTASEAFLLRHACPDTRAALTAGPAAEAPEAGFPVLADNGRRQLLHSLRDPAGEAERIVDGWWRENQPAGDCMVVVFGFGAGWHLEPLLRRLGERSVLVVADPKPTLVQRALVAGGLPPAPPGIQPLRLIANSDLDAMAREYHHLLSHNSRRLNVHFFAWPAALRAFPGVYRDLGRRFLLRTRIELAERNTLYHLSGQWFRNIVGNLPELLAGAPVDALFGSCSGLPAAVIAAGPSLDEALPHLRLLKDRVLLVAVGTALKPLLAAGIDPHLVVVVDGCPEVWEQFRDLPPTRSRLVGIAQTDPRIWNCFRGRSFSYSCSAYRAFENWLASFHAGASCLQTGGTVALTALALAEQMGCGPIYAYGLDLSFPDDGVSHAANSMYHGERHELRTLMRVPGNWQPEVWTTPQFAQYVVLLENFARQRPATGCRLVNVNTRGARIAGFGVSRPDAVSPAEFRECDADIAARLAVACRRSRGTLADARSAIARLTAELMELGTVATTAERLCDRLLDTGPGSVVRARLQEELEFVEERLTAHGQAFDMVEMASHRATLEALGFEPAGAVEDALFRKTLRCSRELYRNLRDTAHDLQEWLDPQRAASQSAVPASVPR